MSNSNDGLNETDDGEETEETGEARERETSTPPSIPSVPSGDDGLDGDEDSDAELFDLAGVDLPDPEDDAGGGDAVGGRYLLRKDGLDYGPYTKEEVLEQLYDDEINEHTRVRDRVTGKRVALEEMPAFADEVEEYVPKREERLRKEQERREEIQRKVKKGGKAALVVAIAVGAVVLIGMSIYYVMQPEPEKLPMERAFVSLDYRFAPPPKDFQTVSVDSDLLASIFNPNASDDEIAERVKKARGGSGGQNTPEPEKGSAEEVSAVDMSESGGSRKHLSDAKINEIILSDWESLRGCVRKELRNNRSFRGVTVKFYVRPSGTTGGVELKESKYENKPVGRCLIKQFRRMKFPEHSAVEPKGVEFPLRTR